MDWTAAGVIVSGLLALVAIVVQQVNRRTDRAEARREAADAGGRADAAQAAADRSAAASERMAKAQEDQAVAAARGAPTPQAAWTLESAGGSEFMLTNVGDAVAHEMHIDLGDTGGAIGNVLDHPAIAPGSAVRFLSAPDFETTDDTVTVTWAAEPGEEPTKTWKRPLPPQTVTIGASSHRASNGGLSAHTCHGYQQGHGRGAL